MLENLLGGVCQWGRGFCIRSLFSASQPACKAKCCPLFFQGVGFRGPHSHTPFIFPTTQ